MNRRGFLTGLIAAPAVIAADRLMPVRLWLPTIYGDGWHDDWEGLMAWKNDERVNIMPRTLPLLRGSKIKHQGVVVIGENESPLKELHITSVYYSDETRKKYFEKSIFRKVSF